MYFPYEFMYIRKLTKAKLSTRQNLLFSNNLNNFVADNQDDWLEYLPPILGGSSIKTKDDPNLKGIKKYSLLIALMT